jgi:hypothetical protein
MKSIIGFDNNNSTCTKHHFSLYTVGQKEKQVCRTEGKKRQGQYRVYFSFLMKYTYTVDISDYIRYSRDNKLIQNMFKPAYAMASVAQTIQHQMTG